MDTQTPPETPDIQPDSKEEPKISEEKPTEKSQNPNSKKKLLLIVALVLVLGLGGLTTYFVTKPKNNDTPSGQTNNSQQAKNTNTSYPLIDGVADCGTKKDLFQTSPIQPNQISTIIPLGNFAPPGHINPTPHMYYNYLSKNNVTIKTNIYTPADMVVTSITRFDNQSAAKPFDSYRIDFAVCQQVRGYFIHVTSINDKLKAAFKEPYDRVQTSDVGAAKVEHTYAKNVHLELKNGELLGTGGGQPEYPQGFDFGLTDFRSPEPTFANAKRWQLDNHYVCSTDYFPAAISSQLLAKIGDYNGLREPGEPKCGVVYQDVPNTAKGSWFQKGQVADNALGSVEAHLTLGINNFNHAQQVFSMGNNLQKLGLDTLSVYGFTPTTSGQKNRDFSQVTSDGNVYCYEAANLNDSSKTKQAIVIQLTDQTTLRIGKKGTSCGAGPYTMTAQYNEYVR